VVGADLPGLLTKAGGQPVGAATFRFERNPEPLYLRLDIQPLGCDSLALLIDVSVERATLDDLRATPTRTAS